MKPPNILLVVLDTARADALEPYGAPAGASPAIAQLARRGLALPDVRATACWTLPSHTALLGGLLARGEGLSQAPDVLPQSAAPVVRARRKWLVSEVLRERGYATAGLSTNVWVSDISGFDAGFDEWQTIDTSRQAGLDGGRRAALRWVWEAARGRADDGAAETAAVLERWIAGAPAQPFFWFVNVVECHAPYLPPRPYGSLSLLDRVRAARDSRRYHSLDGMWRACQGLLDVPEPALARMRRLYAAGVCYADDWVGAIVGRLERAGLLESTAVIVTSDHGENLGEGGLLGHCWSLDDRLLRVPLVGAGPGVEHLRGMRSLAEMPARLARVASIDDHPWADDGLPGGLPVAQFDPPGPWSETLRGLVDRWGAGDDVFRAMSLSSTCAVDGRWKLVVDDDSERLYDLESDPLESHPLTGESMERAAPEALSRLRAAVGHPAVRARGEVAAPTAPQEEVAGLEERLRLLGYL